MKVLICGGRNWDKPRVIEVIVAGLFQLYGEDLVIIEGEARGADSMARDAAEKYGIPVEKYPAKWDEHGKAAGPIRNRQMLKEGKPDLVYAFHNEIDNSKGTKDMVAISRQAGLPVYVVGKA